MRAQRTHYPIRADDLHASVNQVPDFEQRVKEIALARARENERRSRQALAAQELSKLLETNKADEVLTMRRMRASDTGGRVKLASAAQRVLEERRKARNELRQLVNLSSEAMQVAVPSAVSCRPSAVEILKR